MKNSVGFAVSFGNVEKESDRSIKNDKKRFSARKHDKQMKRELRDYTKRDYSKREFSYE